MKLRIDLAPVRKAIGAIRAADAAGIAGAVMVAFGCYQVYGPAGWIVGGVELLVGACFASVGAARTQVESKPN
jgi:hypothetical protein